MDMDRQQGSRTGAALISADRVRGTDVYNRQGERLGDIDSILIDKLSGKVAYVVMSFGGFLGIGERYHPLPWHVLSYDTDKGGYAVDLDRSQLEGAPHYSRDEADRFGSTDDDRSRVDSYYPGSGHRSPDYDDDTGRTGSAALGSAAMAGGTSAFGTVGGAGDQTAGASGLSGRSDQPRASDLGSGTISGSTGAINTDGDMGMTPANLDTGGTRLAGGGDFGRAGMASGSDSMSGRDTRRSTSGGGMGLTTGSDGLGSTQDQLLGRDAGHHRSDGSPAGADEPTGFYSPEAQAERSRTDGDAHDVEANYRTEGPGTPGKGIGSQAGMRDMDVGRQDLHASSVSGQRSDGSARGADEPVGFYSPEAQAERNARDGDTTGADGRLTVGVPAQGQDRATLDAHEAETRARREAELRELDTKR